MQQILCDFSMGLDIKDIIGRKIRAINLMVALASRQETQRQRPSSACDAPVLYTLVPETLTWHSVGRAYVVKGTVKALQSRILCFTFQFQLHDPVLLHSSDVGAASSSPWYAMRMSSSILAGTCSRTKSLTRTVLSLSVLQALDRDCVYSQRSPPVF